MMRGSFSKKMDCRKAQPKEPGWFRMVGLRWKTMVGSRSESTAASLRYRPTFAMGKLKAWREIKEQMNSHLCRPCTARLLLVYTYVGSKSRIHHRVYVFILSLRRQAFEQRSFECTAGFVTYTRSCMN